MNEDMTELERQHENEWLAFFGQGSIEEAEARGWERGWEIGWEIGWKRGWKIGVAIGEVLGEIQSLIKFRGLLCTEEQAAQIEAEEDLETLKLWAERALSAPSVRAILRDEAR